MLKYAFLACCRGATAVEYALLISLICGLCWSAFALLGSELNSTFNNVSTVMPTPSSSSSSSSGGHDDD
jgi:Flp pilus assembly pilin Flp